VEVSKPLVDDFFITAHPAIVTAFTVQPPDERALQLLSFDLVGRARLAGTALGEVGKRAAGLEVSLAEAKECATEARERVEALRTKARDLQNTRKAMVASVHESGAGFGQFLLSLGLPIFAWVVWLVWTIVRLLESPFVASDRLPPPISVAEAQRRIMTAQRAVVEKVGKEKDDGE
jgi:hypothetical protein